MPHRSRERINWVDALPASAQLRSRELFLLPGQPIFAPDPKPTSVFVLKTGLVRLYRLSASGKEFTLGFVRPGEVFGEIAAFAEQPRESFAEAVVRSNVLTIPQRMFAELMRVEPALGCSVLKQLAQRLCRIETLAQNLALLTVRARLANVLLLLMEDFGEALGGKQAIPLHLNQTELASMIGAARPTVNQTFNEFLGEGLVAFENGHLAIADPDRLRRLAQGNGDRVAA